MANDSNLELVQAAYSDFEKGDMATLFASLADDIVWTSPYPRDIVPFGGVWNGKAGVQGFFGALAGSYQITSFVPHTFIATGDHVVALLTVGGTVIETGVQVKEELAHVYRVSDGKISEFREYAAETAALTSAFAPQTTATRA